MGSDPVAAATHCGLPRGLNLVDAAWALGPRSLCRAWGSYVGLGVLMHGESLTSPTTLLV